MEYSRLWSFDDNNSLKRIKNLHGHEVADNWILQGSYYFLSQEFINQFANDVPMRKPPPVYDDVFEDHLLNDDVEYHTENLHGGDPTDGESQSKISDCAKNWKAAASNEKKRMWDIFEETGIFASACHHAMMLWVADMVRSGELYVVLPLILF